MKTLAILSIIAGIFILGGIFLASAGIFDTNSESEEASNTGSTTCTNCPTGGCTASNNCGLSSCGALAGESCGCRG